MEKKQLFISSLSIVMTSILMLTVVALTSCGGDDDNNDSPVPQSNVYIRFSLNNIDTRAVHGTKDVNTYTIETTDGITFTLDVSETDAFPEFAEDNAVITRGKPVESASAMSDFSTYCYDESGNAYYENIAADNYGQLKQQKLWPNGKSLRYYAIHPYDASSANFVSSAMNFAYTYEVGNDVANQSDLMYASTGLLPFNNDGLARLHFHHALAAVKLKIGSMNSNVTKINSITFKNVHSKGTLTLPVSDGTATWSVDESTEYMKDYSLTGLDFTDMTSGTVVNPNEKTFLMLPQDLDEVIYELNVTLSNGSTHTISQSLSTDIAWAAGKTRTYTINVH